MNAISDNIVAGSFPSENLNESGVSFREDIQRRLGQAQALAAEPTTVFCVETFAAAEADGGERLGRLIARLRGNPDRSLILATPEAIVCAFAQQPDADSTVSRPAV